MYKESIFLNLAKSNIKHVRLISHKNAIRVITTYFWNAWMTFDDNGSFRRNIKIIKWKNI